jgi:class 3 adenylate cyclase
MPPATVDMARLHVPPVLQAALSPVPPRPQDTPAPLTAPAGMSPVAPAVRRATPGAERRQLTVLFCDVVGSTALASQPPSYGTL